MYASEKRNVEVVRALLMGWVDIRPIDRMGNTAKDLATGNSLHFWLFVVGNVVCSVTNDLFISQNSQ
jgi:hypothetical protein